MTDKYAFRAMLLLAIGVLSIFALYLLAAEWQILVLIYDWWYFPMLGQSVAGTIGGFALFGMYREKVEAMLKEQEDNHD